MDMYLNKTNIAIGYYNHTVLQIPTLDFDGQTRNTVELLGLTNGLYCANNDHRNR